MRTLSSLAWRGAWLAGVAGQLGCASSLALPPATTAASRPTEVRMDTLEYRMRNAMLGDLSTINVLSRETWEGRERVVFEGRTPLPEGYAILSRAVIDPLTLTGLEARTRMDGATTPPSIDLVVREGRVRGSAMRPGGAVFAVDVAVEPGTLLPASTHPVIWVTPLAPGTTLRLPVFRPLTGMDTLTIEVLDTATVRVPAGEFECYLVRATTLEGEHRMHVTRSAPHVMVREEVGSFGGVVTELVRHGRAAAP